MGKSAVYSLGLGVIAIVIAAIALVMALGASGGGSPVDNISGMVASLSAQNAEIDSLSAQISALQSELSDAQMMEPDGIAELRASIEEMQGEEDVHHVEAFDDSEIRADIAELEGRLEDDHDIDHHIDSLSADISDISDEVSDMQKVMSSGYELIDDFGAELIALRDEIAELRETASSEEMPDIEDVIARLAWLETAVAPAYTKAYVERAIQRYDENRQAALDYYNTMESVDGDLYLFVLDENYNVIVHPTVPSNVGMDIRGPLGTDITGKNFGVEFVTTDENGKWVDYVYLNPAADFGYERKHSWVIRYENLIFGSGWYEQDAVVEEPAAYTQAFVEQAIQRYEVEGLEAALDYYNDESSISGQWYVFIIDSEDMIIGHAPAPDLLNTDVKNIVAPNGYAFGKEVATVTEEGRWINYFWPNPESGMEELKRSWVIRHDGMVFGSGYYLTEENPGAYAQAFVQQTIDRYDSDGREATLEYLNSPESVQGQWYTFVLDGSDLRSLANGARPELVGNIPSRIDATGYNYGEGFAAVTDEGGWVSYVFKNPGEEDELQRKYTWAVLHDGLLFGAGYYEPLGDDPAVQAQVLVREAIDRYNSDGREASLAYHNDPASIDGQWYIFVVDSRDLMVAHPVSPNLIGLDVKTIVASDGQEAGREIAGATESGIWTRYLWPNPESEEEEIKHTWSVRHDGLIFSVGYYE